jgi:threonine dehydratase
VRLLRPEVRVIGVEPELAADAAESLSSGAIVRWEAARSGRTMADGTRSQAIGRRPFEHLSRRLDAVVTVTEAEIAAGVRLIAEEARLVAEPSGALAPAAARWHAADAGLDGLEGTVVAIVSGGNLDPERYRQLLVAPLPA